MFTKDVKNNNYYIKIFSLILLYFLRNDLTFLENLVERYTDKEYKLVHIHDKLLTFSKRIQPRMKIHVPMIFINLNRSKLRLQFMLYQYEFVKEYISSIHRIEGIDGKLLDQNSQSGNFLYNNINYSYRNESESMLTNEIGTTISHILAIKAAYDNNLSYAIICEDDISYSLIPYWKITLSEIVDKLNKQTNYNWDIIRLAPLFCSKEDNQILFKKFTDDWTCYSASCYLINRRGMKNILKNTINKNEIVLSKPSENENQAIADAYIFSKSGITYECISPVLFYCVNNTKQLKSAIANDLDVDHTKTGLETVSRKLNKLCKSKKFNKFLEFKDICKLRIM